MVPKSNITGIYAVAANRCTDKPSFIEVHVDIKKLKSENNCFT